LNVSLGESSLAADTRSRRRAVVALSLLAPVPSLGVIAAMVVAPGRLGHSVFAAAKLWLVLFPAFWYLHVEKGPPSWSPPRRGGFCAGLLGGLGIGIVIAAVGYAAGRGLDPAPLQAAVQEMGLGDPARFLAGAAGWTLVNSLIEEYVYRWFVFSQCERLLPPTGAILATAAIFTVHHVIAVSQYLDTFFTVVASMGVFMGGALWAWLYARYRSIWPGWISHVLADLAVFGIGWWLLFA